MSTPATTDQASSSSSSSTRARGRGKSRGGLGKYLRARGRGRGRGLPAQFTQRLVLSDEEEVELDEEEQKELRSKFARRQLGTNADRYVELEPELGSDGEPQVEPEVDLSSFLERQRISDDTATPSLVKAQEYPEDDDEEVDHTLDNILSSRTGKSTSAPKKGKVTQMEWDEELEDMAREKAASEAKRDLKERFKAKSDKLRTRPIVAPEIKQARPSFAEAVLEAPPLPTAPVKNEKAQMEDFLDDLLG
ncbi:hypothetical protein BDN72DRAFT_889400 [Pluteus cervinus]|uniref:Uncharacterized protein n=1 Tax=Pluteus cervinus TaxID=181527 RepID=A0ACD3AHZ9_9AGAR|nr:hypothetical protein BDN72DRAFT_889400 [Pluteus cervinus]